MLKSIIGYEGYYSVSDEGFVINNRTGRILKPDNCRDAKHKNPYLRITLSRGNIQQRFALHRLVAEYFVDNPDNKPEVNHKDGNRWNNAKDNLEWNTTEENLEHERQNDLFLKGEFHGNAKYSDEQVRLIRKLSQEGLSRKQCAEIAKTTLSFVKDVRNGRVWKHV